MDNNKFPQINNNKVSCREKARSLNNKDLFLTQSRNNQSRPSWCKHIESKVEQAKEALKKSQKEEEEIFKQIAIYQQRLEQLQKKLSELTVSERKIKKNLKKEEDQDIIIQLEQAVQLNAKEKQMIKKHIQRAKLKLEHLQNKQKKIQAIINEIQKYIEEKIQMLLKEDFPSIKLPAIDPKK